MQIASSIIPFLSEVYEPHENKMRIIRNAVVIYDGQLKSLKRFKDDVAEVDAGQECGFALENYNDIKEGDTFESYRNVEISKTLNS